VKFLKFLFIIVIAIFSYCFMIYGKGNTNLKFKGDNKLEMITINAKIKTNKGDINLKLLPNIAPYTVTNFIKLSKLGFYDGLKFHRVINDFMIQGGCPLGTGTGGPGYQFEDEFKDGVVFNKKGILAMANAGPNTNGSQFFITHIPTDWLNYKHTIFGEVVSDSDQEVVDKIVQNDKIETIEFSGDVDKLLENFKDFTDQIEAAVGKKK
jgi:peptidyl-prolyl cis-trans isomerase B (cyclophilin B)